MLKYGNLPDDPTGSLIRACSELLRLEVGMRGPLFHLPTDLRVCTTDTWFSHCWVECIQRGITIDGNIQDFSMQRERDQMIMEIFLRSGYREAELATLNRCRMYLRVIYLSDVCNGQGTAIEPHFWSGNRTSDVHQYSWPKVLKPAPAEWHLWQCALTKGLHLGNSQKLAIPLGKWFDATDKNNQWFTDAEGLELYQRTNDRWFSFTPVLARNRLRSFRLSPIPLTSEQTPTNLMQASVYRQGECITITGRGPIQTGPAEEITNPLTSCWQRCKCQVTTEGSTAQVIQALCDGTAVAVSDGSFKDYAGAAAWTIEGDTAANRVVGTGLTLGNAADQSAYRSELFGLWGILASLKQMVENKTILPRDT